MINSQKGVGLLEVLVAIVLLAIGVLGFTALQLRAMEATVEAGDRASAMNLARDLADRMRINQTALAAYKTAINTVVSETGCLGTATSYLPNCNNTKLANYDATEIRSKAESQGQTIVMADCVGGTVNCIYVAWGTTTITPTDLSACIDTTNGAYVANSKCLVMEAF